MLLSTVSAWDTGVMLGLSKMHGITVHPCCVKSGFDWACRDLNPAPVQCFGNVHFKERDLALARESMLTYHSARRMRPDGEIPTKQIDHDKTHAIRDVSVPNTVGNASGNACLFMMSPDHIQAAYTNRIRRMNDTMLQLLDQVPIARAPEVHISIQESVNNELVSSDSVMPRAQRQAACDVIRRNAELFQKLSEQSVSECGDSSDGESSQGWGANGDNSSDEDDIDDN
jgi:hypothetical protein